MRLLDRHLQILRRPKGDFLACLDFDRLASCGIAAHAGCALSDLEDAKARDADSFAFLEMLCDYSDQVAEDGFTSPLRQMIFLGQGRSKDA